MTYFLTSNPLLLDGSRINPANDFESNLKHHIQPQSFVLYIASSPDAYEITELYGNELRVGFESSGFEFSQFVILDDRNSNDLEALISQADVLVLAGGHVPTQNLFFKTIQLHEHIASFDGTIIGISAGSMNSATIVYSQPEFDDEASDVTFNPFLQGLGLTNIQIIPHYQLIKNETLNGKRLFEDITYPLSVHNPFYALNDGSYIFGDGVHETLYGESFLINDGTLTKICNANDSVKLA